MASATFHLHGRGCVLSDARNLRRVSSHNKALHAHQRKQLALRPATEVQIVPRPGNEVQIVPRPATEVQIVPRPAPEVQIVPRSSTSAWRARRRYNLYLAPPNRKKPYKSAAEIEVQFVPSPRRAGTICAVTRMQPHREVRFVPRPREFTSWCLGRPAEGERLTWTFGGGSRLSVPRLTEGRPQPTSRLAPSLEPPNRV